MFEVRRRFLQWRVKDGLSEYHSVNFWGVYTEHRYSRHHVHTE